MEDIKLVHMIFMTFLAAAAWQDLRNKSISVWLVFRGQRALLKLL